MKKVLAALLAMLLVGLLAMSSMETAGLQKEVRAFMAVGDRNTGSEGFERDMQLNALDARLTNVEQMIEDHCRDHD